MKSTLVFLLSFLFLNSYSQETIVTDDDETVYENVDEQPEFLGYEDLAKGIKYVRGTKGLLYFLLNNVKYPNKAKEKNIQGKVELIFVTDKTGYMRDLKIKESVNILLDQEALRVASLLKDKLLWTPGKIKGNNVNTLQSLPVQFKFQ